MILPADQMLATVWHITCIYWMLVWMISLVLQSLVCYTASHVLIHLENEWSYPLIELYRPYGIWHVFIRCLYEWSRKSCQSLVLYCFTCSYTPWKRMILPTDQMLSTIWHITLFIGWLYEWSRKSCQSLVCYTASHVFIHIENEWSYPLIELYRPYGILHVFIGCLYEWSRESCQSLVC